MGVTLTIPETIFEQSGGEITRELLETAVLEAFRANAISLGRLAEILDLTTDEANGFLKSDNVHYDLTLADLQESRGVLNALLKDRLEGIER